MASMMFPRSLVSSDPMSSFTPLFRLLDDFDMYNRGSMGGQNQQQQQHMRSFNPRFDVKELSDCYELHGEFPGMEQKDIDIEFLDAQTLTVRGHCERVCDSMMTQDNMKRSGYMTGNGNQYHQSSMEEDNTRTMMSGKTSNDKSMTQSQSMQPMEKYWVCERQCGEFSRSFSFPARVDQDQVKASMKNGILSICVPKSTKKEGRKINIS